MSRSQKGKEKSRTSVGDLLESRAVKGLLEDLVEDLPTRERQVIRLKFWSNMNISEIAQCLGVRDSTVQNILSGGMRRLKQKRNRILSVYENEEG